MPRNPGKGDTGIEQSHNKSVPASHEMLSGRHCCYHVQPGWPRLTSQQVEESPSLAAERGIGSGKAKSL